MYPITPTDINVGATGKLLIVDWHSGAVVKVLTMTSFAPIQLQQQVDCLQCKFCYMTFRLFHCSLEFFVVQLHSSADCQTRIRVLWSNGVAMSGVSIYMYNTPSKNQAVNFLWGINDVRTVNELILQWVFKFYFPKLYSSPKQISGYPCYGVQFYVNVKVFNIDTLTTPVLVFSYAIYASCFLWTTRTQPFDEKLGSNWPQAL